MNKSKSSSGRPPGRPKGSWGQKRVEAEKLAIIKADAAVGRGQMQAIPRKHGRRKGAFNRISRAEIAKILAAGDDPLEFLLSVMRDVDVPLQLRLEAAKAAAPYVHPKLLAVDNTHRGADGGAIEVRWVGEVALGLAPAKPLEKVIEHAGAGEIAKPETAKPAPSTISLVWKSPSIA